MKIEVHQNITIYSLKVEGITNSSILQIGSAGVIKALSHLYNTGGFTKPAPEFESPRTIVTEPSSLVPLPPTN